MALDTTYVYIPRIDKARDKDIMLLSRTLPFADKFESNSSQVSKQFLLFIYLEGVSSAAY